MMYAAIMILVWEAVGFGLSYHKGQMEDSVTWIGATLTADAGGVRAQIKQSIIDDICGDLKRMAAQNVVSKKELHSLIGKLGHCASLLIIMRPFLEPMWAALYSTGSSNAPLDTLRTKQISSPLQWFQAFFTTRALPIERYFRLDAYLRQGTVVEIGTDDSPFGMGGWLTIDGILTNYFATDITKADERSTDAPEATRTVSNVGKHWQYLSRSTSGLRYGSSIGLS